jgi:hypothetical protein
MCWTASARGEEPPPAPPPQTTPEVAPGAAPSATAEAAKIHEGQRTAGIRVGGHAGFALPIASFDNDGAHVIGRDFGSFGLTPGLTLKITENWAVDFEFIAFSRWEKGIGNANVYRTIFVVDPGVVYNFGKVAVGGRLAMQIGEGVPFNLGIVPILVVPFKISSKLSYFIELDLPVFVMVRSDAAIPPGKDRVLGSMTILLQTGFGF